jgi:hypothetical protein
MVVFPTVIGEIRIQNKSERRCSIQALGDKNRAPGVLAEVRWKVGANGRNCVVRGSAAVAQFAEVDSAVRGCDGHGSAV